MTSQKENNANIPSNLIKFEGKDFTKVNLSVDYKSFDKCNFTDCILVYYGSEAVNIQNCKFNNVKWSFAGYAANTVEFMRAIYHGTGVVGEQAIETVFNRIKNNTPLPPSEEIFQLSDITEDLVSTLPDSIGDYLKRILQLDNLVVIEYSKRALMMRHVINKKVEEETLKENLLFEVVSPNIENAVLQMQNILEVNKNKIDEIVKKFSPDNG